MSVGLSEPSVYPGTDASSLSGLKLASRPVFTTRAECRGNPATGCYLPLFNE
ncbi:MAG: hypothetical protein QG602_2804, partial [Verrucomicrobiota bacterium]|nr:hypothetical protein [Verrucomicrobiota bacterium]